MYENRCKNMTVLVWNRVRDFDNQEAPPPYLLACLMGYCRFTSPSPCSLISLFFVLFCFFCFQGLNSKTINKVCSCGKNNANLHSMNNSWYYCKFINMFEQHNLISLDTESLDNDKIGRYTTEMREKYPVSFLRHSLEN